MPRHPRWLRGDAHYCSVQRTVERRFLFKPDELIRNLVGSAAGRALERFPVKLYWLDYNINHKQNGKAPLSDSPEHLNNLVKFEKMMNSIVAREINEILGRDGALYSSRNRTSEALDDMSLEQQLFYAVLNPVKDGLVDRIAHWKGFSSYDQLAHGNVETFTYIDKTAWHKAGGERCKRPINDFLKTTQVKLTPLPAWERMTPDARQAHFRREVRKYEKHCREERRREGRGVMGPKKLAKLDHRDRPNKPAKRSPKPLCHASTVEARKEYKKRFRAFLDQYYYASQLWMQGVWEVEFPHGSFRPPLIACAC